MDGHELWTDAGFFCFDQLHVISCCKPWSIIHIYKYRTVYEPGCMLDIIEVQQNKSST